ncbi:ABC transporter permease subunit [Thermosynechococcaceae cyanobacterium BACA0444]|uniref:ABC transporter permease subunit n=1 Tax=Pseudocalidococcus azoricus BACA0444 TaxID=2918990 RepID=A0AAE4JYY6_9CYAN|nr:ABC transporter permease subunit [Pseudocalidococcus azoricus]MDS3860262.1 ABC transporter permease subunit [Pseudocalidococcus azoricus BACA0444]
MKQLRLIFANILAIYRRELQSYFYSPFAYVIAGIFWLLAGIFFVVIVQTVTQQAAQNDLAQQQFGMAPQPIDVPQIILQGFLGVLGSISQVILPMLSMSLYTEERKRGTLELLATSPITNWAVAVGKLLAVVTFYLTLIVPLLIYQSLAYSAANPPMSIALILVGHGGLVLLAAVILSLGMFISSLTDNTIIAAVMTFALILVLWIFDIIAKSVGGDLGSVLTYLSPVEHFNSLTQGVIKTNSLVLFATYIFLGIYLTAQSIDAFRFQRS